MKRLIWEIFVVSSLAAAAYGQTTLSGSVRDDAGVIPSGVTVELRQRPDFVGTSPSGRPTVGLGYHASMALGEGGSFLFEGVPPGSYFVCAYSSSPGFLASCEWASQHSPITIGPSQNTTVAPIILRRGTIINILLSDPNNELAKGHRFHAGVITASGYYKAAVLLSESGTSQSYVTTIPNSAEVRLLIDADVAVTEASGSPITLRSASDITIDGGTNTTVQLYLK